MKTDDPAFCSQKCHGMQPYYDSWNTSTHKDVNCKECHYEPGAIGWLKGKTKDSLRLYGSEVESYPDILLAKVKDESCMKCHGKRIEYGEVTSGRITFYHKNHIYQKKREITLRCTSCHSMLVVGMAEHRTNQSCALCHKEPSINLTLGHVTVTKSSCFTCHFRNTSENKSISGCPSCHGAPIGFINYSGRPFEHQLHLYLKYTCTTCHVNITVGANDIVPKEKCTLCHSNPENIKKYDDFKLVHYTHVTANSIPCYNCHSRVKHEPGLKDNLCAGCHNRSLIK